MKAARALDGRRILRLNSGLQIRLGNLIAAVGLAVTAAMLAIAALMLGHAQISTGDLVRALSGGELSGDQLFAIIEVRAPRIAIGFMAGWCVAVTGAMLQSLARNPLADPGLLGLSQGAMVTIMLVLVFAPNAPTGFIPLAALVGGLGVAAILGLLAGTDRSGGLAILLIGIAVETVLSSVSSILILYAPPETSYALASWMSGSLFSASWPRTAAILPWCALSLPVIWLAGPVLRALDLGAPRALSLGVGLSRAQPAILVAAVLLNSAAVTAVGPLIFLGVMAPHLASFLSPASGRARLLLSGMTGGLLVISADILTRAGLVQAALPIGLSLTILGVPLFIIALRLRALRIHSLST
ncbi:FecCD family ABC transporter permease [Actibacterium lipolyticum]|uniref:Iron-uptake system permease protein FeuC n=1 Tax=Actibacterium lipolyticum TaxID=1524263 RepID=A0A238L7J4_9RHOB|nr:iron ABC transporter permease [Actibacterium lipolyticum]SMX51065.1 Iron-uptake system permease protein FeuC [Actibacterium lipolyticum]